MPSLGPAGDDLEARRVDAVGGGVHGGRGKLQHPVGGDRLLGVVLRDDGQEGVCGVHGHLGGGDAAEQVGLCQCGGVRTRCRVLVLDLLGAAGQALTVTVTERQDR